VKALVDEGKHRVECRVGVGCPRPASSAPSPFG
jgi:hypothetical protein